MSSGSISLERQASDLIFHSEELAFPYCIELREENEK